MCCWRRDRDARPWRVSTEPRSPQADRRRNVSSAVRLVALTDGDAIARRTTTPFVGRATELDALVTAFERVVADGAPGLVTVIGAPGVGKSRLVAEALRPDRRARHDPAFALPAVWRWDHLLAGPRARARGGQHRTRRITADGVTRLEAVVAGSDQAHLVLDRVAAVVGLSDVPAPAEEIRWAVGGIARRSPRRARWSSSSTTSSGPSRSSSSCSSTSSISAEARCCS